MTPQGKTSSDRGSRPSRSPRRADQRLGTASGGSAQGHLRASQHRLGEVSDWERQGRGLESPNPNMGTRVATGSSSCAGLRDGVACKSRTISAGMGDKSAIEWTDASWNPVTGCSKVSAGCKNCYAETLAKRLRAMGVVNYRNGFRLTLQPHMLELPKRWRQPRRIFVNSMSDVFHDQVPDYYVDLIFDAMEEAEWHIYQLLTKRPERMAEYVARRYGDDGAPTHIWLGTSVEDERVLDRVRHLRATPAVIRFLSCEPLLGPLSHLDLTDIDWVIVGGESGRRHRPFDLAWAREIRDNCRRARVPFFFKQVGGRTPKSGGRMLDGRTWDQIPKIPRIPNVAEAV